MSGNAKRLKKIQNRISFLKSGKYIPGNELYRMPNGEFVSRSAYRAELKELELERDRIIEKGKHRIDDDRRWLNTEV